MFYLKMADSLRRKVLARSLTEENVFDQNESTEDRKILNRETNQYQLMQVDEENVSIKYKGNWVYNYVVHIVW